MSLPKLMIKSELGHPSMSRICLDGVEQEGITKATIHMTANRANSDPKLNLCVLEFIPELIKFEGDAEIYALINGRRYKLEEQRDE